MKRREFLKFLGAGSASMTILGTIPACQSQKIAASILGINPSDKDMLLLAPQLDFNVLVRWGDLIGQNLTFGFNNDYIAFFPISPLRGILWVNHEDQDPKYVSDYRGGEKDQLMVDLEMENVGGSIIEIARQPTSGQWTIVPRSEINRRITAKTIFPFSWHEPIAGKKEAMGTLANCAGGVTPWGNVLTCEENFQTFYGDVDFKSGKRSKGKYSWEKFYPNPTEHYGWVVEINPKTGEGKKLVALGRMAHEGATVTVASDGRAVVYMGDDLEDEHLYKFIAARPGSLEEGTLYVANLELGRWLSLNREESPILKEHFKNQTEIQIFTRYAAKLLGATELARPEDIEINPHNQEILVALTNNKSKKNMHGSIISLQEKNQDPKSLEFSSTTFLAGGEANGFSSPDNLIFDKSGNLWFTSDMSNSVMGKGEYAHFKNNGLFLVPTRGADKGRVIQLASAPRGAEFTGPCFTPDGETLFLSVQHPGEGSPKENPTSHWPDGGMPTPSVVQISGPLLQKIYDLK